MKSSMRNLILGLSAGLLTLTSELQACPMCKMALETDDPQPRAYMTSILFMLGMMGTVSIGVYFFAAWVSRLEQRALTEAGYGHLFDNAVTRVQEGLNPTVAIDGTPLQ